jgi:hypothetical protein
VQQRPELLRCGLPHRRQHTGVNVQRDADVCMSEPSLHDVRWDASLQQQRCARVSQTMQCDRANVRGLDQPRELPLSDVVRLERQAQRCLTAVQVCPLAGEDEPKVVIGDPVLHLQLGLRLLVGLQQRHRVGPDVDGARLPVLGWPENRLRPFWTSCRTMAIVPLSRSTSLHWSPHIPPRCAAVCSPR